MPWWKKHVRPDYVTVKLKDALFQTAYETNQKSSTFSIQSQAVDILYHESESSTPITIAKACCNEKCASVQEIFNSCRYLYFEACVVIISYVCLFVFFFFRLTLEIFPVGSEVELDNEVENEPDIMSQSIYGAFSTDVPKESGPFSSKRSVHESDTPHDRSHQGIVLFLYSLVNCIFSSSKFMLQ